MKIAITGGTGFVGRHLARALVKEGHEVVLITRGQDRRGLLVCTLPRTTFMTADLLDAEVLVKAFAGCDGVAHCAGINRELGSQTFERVHVHGTRNVLRAAELGQVKKIAMLSFLRARPQCGSKYHETKWAAEQLIRQSGFDYTILKAGVIYGRGDHMLDHLSRAFHMVPFLPTVGLADRAVRPLAVQDLTRVLKAALVDGRLARTTLALTGPEEMTLGQAARRIAEVCGKRISTFGAPVWFHRALAVACEWTMKVPLVARAQVFILAEGVAEPWGETDGLPSDLQPALKFSAEQIRKGLPEPGGFGWHDLRCCRA